MKKQNMPLAMEILRDEKRHTRFWFTVFLVMLAVSVTSYIVKGGTEHGRIDMLDQIFIATSKLELMQTVLSVLINTVEKEEANTQEKALHFAANQNMISDFLHITLDGVYFAIQTLNEAQNSTEGKQDEECKEITELLSSIDNA